MITAASGQLTCAQMYAKLLKSRVLFTSPVPTLHVSLILLLISRALRRRLPAGTERPSSYAG
jgi:hypothetical protein